jgi:dTDP-4-dehydrorhamnose reductase
MKILLLGKNGQLGSDILDFILANGQLADHIALSRDDLDVSELCELEQRLSSLDFDVLINCTSIHKTDDIEESADRAFTVNAKAVELMAKVSKFKNAKFIHISTDYVFGGITYAEPISETEPCAPINVYGASKALGEQLALMTHKKTIIIRVASLFGVRGASGKGGNFIETMIRLFEERDTVTVVSDQIMSPTYTADIAEVLCKGIFSDMKAGIYNVVNSGSCSWYELAKYVADKLESDCKIVSCSSYEFKTLAKRPAYSVLDNSKITSLLGNIPTWKNAVDRYLFAKGYIH